VNNQNEYAAPEDAPFPVLEDAQQDVDRWLGRCVIRLQRYEYLLKALLASMDVEGEPQALDDALTQRQLDLHLDTLGTIVKQFTNNHLTTHSKAAVPAKKRVSPRGADGWVGVSFRVAMTPAQQAQRHQDLKGLVAMRNDLMHHLVEMFDLTRSDGCHRALSHLQECYEKISVEFKFLNELADHVEKARLAARMALESPSFEAALLHGLRSEGTSCLHDCIITECLRDADDACRIDGWTALDDAIVFVGKHYVDEFPSKYGCKTWRQILKRAACFDIRITPGGESNAGKAWYRTITTA
jgi:hypothetical protein